MKISLWSNEAPASRRKQAVAFLMIASLGMIVIAAGLSLNGCSKLQREREQSRVDYAPASPGLQVGRELNAPPASVVMADVDELKAAKDAGNIESSGGSMIAVLATAEASTIRQQIIYTGEMSLEVNDVESAAKQLETIVSGAGGWLSSRTINADAEGRRAATLVIRIPSAQFSAVHESLGKLGEVGRDAIQSRDVGKDFVDLEARRRNLGREESVITDLFQRKGKIGDVLQVERELARVRGEMEQIEGELRYLTNQVAYSTLCVTIAPQRPVTPTHTQSWSLGYHATRASRTLFGLARAITTAAVYLLIVGGPLALVAWMIAGSARAIARRRAALATRR
jgi:hypothetical protein